MPSITLRITLFLYLFFVSILAYPQDDVLQKQLHIFQQHDNLSEWIYKRLDHVTEKPQERLSYLMETSNKTWRKAKTAAEHYAWLTLLSTQGYYQLLDGNILGSTQSYESSYAYYLKNKVVDFDIVEYTAKPLSNNYTRLGDYERALYLQLLAVKFLHQTKANADNIAAIYSNIAISYRSMGNLNEATKSIKKGLELAKKHSQVNIILNNILADILFDQQAYIPAKDLIELNITKQKRIDAENAYWLMGSYTSAGNIYKKLNNLQKSADYFERALAILNTYYNGTRLREKANILTHLGSVKLLEKNPRLALQYFNKTLITLKILANNKINTSKIYGDNMVVDVFQEMATAYLQLNQPQEAFQKLKYALLSGDKIRNEFASDKTKEYLQANLKSIAEKAIEIAFELYQQNKNKKLLNEILGLTEQTKSRTLLDQINRNQRLAAATSKDSLFIKKQAYEGAIIYQEKQAIEGKTDAKANPTAKLKYFLSLIDKQIKQKYPQFNTSTSSLPIVETLSKLPGQRIVSYFFGEKSVYLINIEHRQATNIIRYSHSSEIKSIVQAYAKTYFQQGPNAMINNPKEFYLAANQIYNLLVKCINLRKNEPLIVIPDDVLGYLSFDGLITNDNYQPNISNWPFLIKNNQISYAFSLTTLATAQNKRQQTGFTGLFISHQQQHLKLLKAIKDEITAIKKAIRSNFILDDQVNILAFNEAFEKSSILHIGTHAYLSGKNQEPTLDLGKEKLYLFELSAKKSTPSLVFLSACRTADGLLANGEGIISLSRGFNAIGTPATIAGLWNVNDAAASIIVGNFYAHLAQHKSNAEALHLAKADWLKSPQNNNAFYLPYYWDNLIYMGADQHLTVKSSFNWSMVLMISAGCLFAFGIIWLRLRKQRKRITA